MDTRAIYLIDYNQKTYVYRTQYAGGFSYPFAVEQSLLNMLKDPDTNGLGMDELVGRLTGNDNYPAEAMGLPLFEPFKDIIGPGGIESHLYTDNPGIPFLIALDLDRETISLYFNRNYPELKELPYLTLPLYGIVNENCQLWLACILHDAEESGSNASIIRTFHDPEDYFSMFKGYDPELGIKAEEIYRNVLPQYLHHQAQESSITTQEENTSKLEATQDNPPTLQMLY